MKKLISIQPMFNRLVTTMDLYDTDQVSDGLIDPRKPKGSLKEYQTVIAVGTTVRDIKVGDVVAVNPTRYTQLKHNDKSMKNGVIDDNIVVGYKFNTITLNGKEHLMLYDQDIDFIIKESIDVEDTPAPAVAEVAKPKIIVSLIGTYIKL